MLFDLVVLGTDPAGWAAARLAAKLGRNVAVVDDPDKFSRFRDAALEAKLPPGIRHFSGSVRFRTPDSLEIAGSGKKQHISSQRFLLASGNRPKRPAHIPFDGQRILDSDEAREKRELPPTLLIVGAGEHGLACAGELLKRGLRVSLVDQSPRIPFPTKAGFGFGESSIRCPVHWGTAVLGVECRNSAVTVFYDNGAIETFGGVVFAVGRLGCTEHLNLPRPDLLLDESFRIWGNEWGQTGVPHIYAAGTLMGFPRFPGSPEEEAKHIIEHLYAEPIPPRPAFLRGKKLVPRH